MGGLAAVLFLRSLLPPEVQVPLAAAFFGGSPSFRFARVVLVSSVQGGAGASGAALGMGAGSVRTLAQ